MTVLSLYIALKFYPLLHATIGLCHTKSPAKWWFLKSRAATGKAGIARYRFAHIIAPRQSPSVMTNAQCNAYWSTGLVQAQNVCLDPYGGRSACHGDSGGPLAVQDAGRSLQVGIASFVSANGCTSGAPSVWVRVSYFRDFISQNSNYVFRA